MKTKIYIFICLIFLFLGSKVNADGIEDTPLGRSLIDIGLRFLENPGDLFLNLNINNEDFSPLPSHRHGAIRFNFFPTFFPVTWGNLNLKINILKEHNYSPQVDLVGMYSDIIVLRLIESNLDDFKPSFYGYSLGTVLTKSQNENTKLFGGFKFSNVDMEVRFSTPIAFGEFEMSSLDFKVADTFIFTGIYHQTKPENILVAQVGYGFKYKKIISRIMVSHKHLELGLDIYPEGLFVLHPFLAWHWYF